MFDIEALAKEMSDVYYDIDPYGMMDAYESKEESIESAIDTLKCWTPEEIWETIIKDLQECIDDEMDDDGSIARLIQHLDEYIDYLRNSDNHTPQNP